MTNRMTCPTLPELLGMIGGEADLNEISSLVRHFVTCHACIDTLLQLKVADEVVERLRAPQQSLDSLENDQFNSLILSFQSAIQAGQTKSKLDQTLPSQSSPEKLDDSRNWSNTLPISTGDSDLGEMAGYRILRLIGSGGMGAVFEAEETELARRVALKVPHPAMIKSDDARERFLREARAVAGLKDEHIVTIYRVGLADGSPFLAMELLQGESLEDRLQKAPPLSIPEAVHIARETAQGLAVAHDQGLIHRDIKPANIWLVERVRSERDSSIQAGNRVKLLDFGLARSVDPDMRLTVTGQIVGTPHYMSPEQGRGEPLDHRSDLFSLGAVLYEMLSNVKPFEGTSVMAVLTALATTTPEPLSRFRPEIPASLEQLVEQLLTKESTQRPADAWKVVERLRAIEAEIGNGTMIRVSIPTVRSEAPTDQARLNRRRWIAASVAGVVGLAGVGSLLLGRPWAGNPTHSPDADTLTPIVKGPPIRVGILHSRTGTMARSERPVIDTTLLAIEQINQSGGLLGSDLEPVLEDGQSDPTVFNTKAEKLITEAGVVAVFGCWTSASRKAVRRTFEKYNHLLMYPVQYEGLEMSPNIFYLGASPNQQIIPAVKWACSFLKKKRLFLVGSDYVFPRIAKTIIRDQVETMNCTIVGEEYLLLGSTDVKAVVDKIAESDADLILNTINGDTNLAFFRGLRNAGIRSEQIPTMSFSVPEEELSSFSPREVAGDYAAWNYFQSIDSPQNRAFLNLFQKRYSETRIVSDPMEAAYVGVKLWAQAVREANDARPDRVRRALRSQRYDAPEGRVKIDPETQHMHKYIRIGQINAEGRFDVVYCSDEPIVPVPFPETRTRAEWELLLNDLHLGWGGSWVNPGRE